MRRILIFVEDYAHEEFVTALLHRLAHENGIQIAIVERSVRGGHGQVLGELRTFLRDLDRGREALPDLLVVATDANCKGYVERKKEVDEVIEDYIDFTICAIPNPHIERWLLIDSSAFKAVVGRGCAAPDQKCDRDRYKQLLMQAMQEAGIIPPLGGVEYTEDIVNALDFTRAAQADSSFERFLKDLVNKFKAWAGE